MSYDSDATTTPTEMSPRLRARSEVSDVEMLDSEDRSATASTYSTASNMTEPVPDDYIRSSPEPPFFRLPPEVRDQIYALCLLAPYAILWPAPSNDAGLQPQLLRVCKRIYSEAAPLLYHNQLNFMHPSDANMFIPNHNRELAQCITRLHLTIRDRDVRSIWTAWLGSTSSVRSLAYDYPALQTLHITLTSRFWDFVPGSLEDKFGRWAQDKVLRELALNLEKCADRADVRILVVHSLPLRDVITLLRAFPNDIFKVAGGSGEIRTRWLPFMKLEVALELQPNEEFEG